MKQYNVLKQTLAFVLTLAMVLTGTFPNGIASVQAAQKDDLLLYYDFDLQNSFATQINDVSGHMNAGELKSNSGGSVEGTYSISNVNIYGNTVKALKLTGGDSGPYLKLPDGILNGHDAVTISMWVNLSTDNGYQRIWDFGNDTTSYMYLLSDGGNEGFIGYAAAITTGGWSKETGIQKGTNISKNRWVLTTVVMDGSTMSLYENGTLIGTKDTGIKVSDLGATVGNYIGKGQFNDNPTEGQFAEVKIFDKALSAEEVAAMYTVDDAGIVAGDKAELSLGDTSAITSDFALPTKGVNESTITWSSTNPAIQIEDGTAKVTRPAQGAENAVGKLTATITYNEASDTKDFDVVVISEYTDEQIVNHDAEAAVKAVGDLSSIMGDITLPLTGEWGSTITWTSANSAIKIEDGTAKVTRPEVGSENISGKLTATISFGSKKATKEIDATVLAYREAASISKVDDINVTTIKGHSPSLPNFVKVTYSDGSYNKLKTIWPNKIEASQYTSAGKFTVEGSIVGETTKITANVTVVDQQEVAKYAVSKEFDLSDISLDGDSILTQNRARDLVYLKLLDNKRMLYNFYNTFGQTDKIKNVQPLGGWDEPSGLLRGHSTGHYMSALALAYASTGDSELKTKLDEMVSELRTLQKMSSGNTTAFTSKGTDQKVWSTNPAEWGEGFLSAYSPDQFALLEKYTPYAQIWAPYYTLHKLIAGLLDAYYYTGNTEALEAAEALGSWVYTRLSACTANQLSTMWAMYIAGEFGGFNESLAKLYLYTGNEKFLNAAKLFDNTDFFNYLSNNVDDIAGHHANQHIPQIIGAIEMYNATVKKGSPEIYYYDIAENFWRMTVSRYAYSIGGVGTGEKFTEAYKQAANIAGTTNCETCAAYNMLKLTKMLNKYNPDDAEYMDYYERTLYNQILASQTPNVTASLHNGTTYMLPIGPGSTRDFGDDYNSFTCCHGTGMENHVKYQEAAYEKTDDTLYVSLYMPTTLTWEEKGVKVTQEMAFPSENTKLTVSTLEGKTAQAFNMKLRVPYWATNGFTVKLNNETVIENPEISTYVELKNVTSGDVIEIQMPWTLHLDKTPDKIGTSEVASVMYGPYVMAAQIDSTDWKTLVLSSNLSDSIKVSKNETTGFPTLTANGYNFAPMFSPEYATKAYDAYFKVLTANDDGSKWYEASVTNTTPKFGSLTISADMVKEGTELVITAAPNDGYMVKLLTINGEKVEIGADNTYTVKNVSSDLVVEGSFRLINPPTPDPAHLEYTAAVSSDYTSSWENLDGIMTDWEPTQSAAGTGKGWGNWSQTEGSEHYVQYEWDTEVTMDTFQIYWYDDGGGTRIPASIKFLYIDENGAWKEAEMLSKYEDVIKTDAYNTIKITPIKTTAVKMVLTVLSGGAANGVLRWKVSDESSTPTPATDKTALAAAIQSAEALSEKDYTTDSWKAFSDALAAAKKVNEKADAIQTEVDAAADALKNAQNALVKASGDTINEQSAPANVKAAWKGAKKVQISWSAAKGAVSYIVSRSYSKTGTYTKLGTVKTTSYLDKNAALGKTAYYKVTAVNGNKTASSTIASATVLKTPAKVKVTAKKKKVTVSFKKTAGANGYEIYRSNKKSKGYKKAAVLKGAKKVKKVFKSVKKGTYYYKVRAFKTVNGKKVYTGYGKAVKIKVK